MLIFIWEMRKNRTIRIKSHLRNYGNFVFCQKLAKERRIYKPQFRLFYRSAIVFNGSADFFFESLKSHKTSGSTQSRFLRKLFAKVAGFHNNFCLI